jgi:hypothetical protein
MKECPYYGGTCEGANCHLWQDEKCAFNNVLSNIQASEEYPESLVTFVPPPADEDFDQL